MYKLAIAISAGLLAVIPLTVAAPLALAQTSVALEAPLLAFDAVSVRPADPTTDRETIESPAGGDGITLENMTVEEIVGFAYDFHRRELVSGLPEWAMTKHYDLAAKVADAEVSAFHKLTQAQRKTMLRLVLANRFGLKAHRTQREMPIFALAVAKGGPKMKEAKPGDTYSNGTKLADGSPAGAGTLVGLTGQGVTMAAFAVTLSRIDLGREVLDRTGLTAKYDFALRCAPVEAMRPIVNGQMQPLSSEDSALPSIFTALEEQLGLKLQPTKGMVEALVIDHIDRPSEN